MVNEIHTERINNHFTKSIFASDGYYGFNYNNQTKSKSPILI